MHTTDPLTVGEIARRSGFAESAVSGWIESYLCPNATRSQLDPFEKVSPDRITIASTT